MLFVHERPAGPRHGLFVDARDVLQARRDHDVDDLDDAGDPELLASLRDEADACEWVSRVTHPSADASEAPPVHIALGAWRRDDVDDLELEPGDLWLLARLRAGDYEEPPDR